MSDNTNNRKTRIKRAGSFLSRAQGKDIDDYFENASLSIGSYFESTNSKRIASGMPVEEENILLPLIFGIPRNDREYLKMRDDFFAALEVKVPHKDGVEFEVGLEDNTKKMSETNLPIDMHQYIRFKFASKHPWVAASQAEAEGNQIKKFFVHDEVSATNEAANLNDLKDEALAYFLAIKSNDEKVKMMLTLLGTDWRDITGQNAAQEKQLRLETLRKLVDVDPGNFKKIHEDKNFDVKYKIQMMVNTQVLTRIGNKYLVAETGDSIGNYEETVQFFKDEAENSDKIAVLTAKLQEASKAGKKKARTIR